MKGGNGEEEEEGGKGRKGERGKEGLLLKGKKEKERGY